MAPTYAYGFRAWVERHLGPGANAAAVKRYFDQRGIELSQEKWRVFLHQAPARPDMNVWLDICDATGERLSAFIDYEPCGRPPQRVKELRKPPAPTRPTSQREGAAPPDPLLHYRGER